MEPQELHTEDQQAAEPAEPRNPLPPVGPMEPDVIMAAVTHGSSLPELTAMTPEEILDDFPGEDASPT